MRFPVGAESRMVGALLFGWDRECFWRTIIYVRR